MSLETSSLSPIIKLGIAHAASTTCSVSETLLRVQRDSITHLESTKDVSLGVGKGLALLEHDRARNVVVVLADERLETVGGGVSHAGTEPVSLTSA